MVNLGIFGSSGEIGNSLLEFSLKCNVSVHKLSRSFALGLEEDIEDEKKLIQDIDCYVFCNGKFTINPISNLSVEEIAEEMNANLIFQIQATARILKLIDASTKTINIVYLGSTSAYNGFANTSVYCAAKFGLRGFVESMNAEYKNTNIRFSLFSFGTVKNRMGLKIKDQNPETFLNMENLAKEIFLHSTNFSNQFQPETIVRRRVIE